MTASLIEFPCDFPLKVIGHAHENFKRDIAGIIRHHFPDIQPSVIRERASRNQNYLAISITVHVHSQAELDAFYQALTQNKYVVMVL